MYFDSFEMGGDAHPPATPADIPDSGMNVGDGMPGDTGDAATHPDVLPDGRATVVVGDVDALAEFNHLQGDNPFGYQQDCGLVSVQDVLNQFGIPVTESDVVAHAITSGECDNAPDPAKAGGTNPADQVQVLADFGISSHTENDQSLSQLADEVGSGHRVIIGANAGLLWNDPTGFENGQANHAVTVTGLARDPETGQIQGFFINDSGTGESGEFVSADVMTAAWLHTGGEAVVVDDEPAGIPAPVGAPR